MKIFIITIDDVFDYEGFHHDPIVKMSEEEAREQLENLYLSAKETYTDEFDSEERSDTSFSLFPDGNWGTSHYDARINEVEVEIPPRYEHIASITERCGNGESFSCILHSGTPEGLAKEVIKYLETEENERELGLDYDKERITDECHGNEASGPLCVEAKDWDTEFIISTKRIVI